MTRKIIILFIILVTPPVLATSQVFNTGSYLKKKGHFTLGIEPAFQTKKLNSGLVLNAFGAYCLGYSTIVDFDASVGQDIYFGLGVLQKLDRLLGVSFGAHYSDTPGLDGGLNILLPIDRDLSIFTGLDADLDIGADISTPCRLPFGFVMTPGNSSKIILEVGLALNKEAYTSIGLGLAQTFR